MRPYPDNEAVFTLFRENRPGKPNAIVEMRRRYERLAGVKGGVNPEASRDAFPRGYVLNGGDLASASVLMGHMKIAVTKHF